MRFWRACSSPARYARCTPGTERTAPHRAAPGRFHDLVDLVLITSSCQIDAAELIRSLTQQAAIRDLQLPAELQPPGPAWTGGYSRAAEQASTLSAELRSLAAALAAAGRCLNPILSGVVTAGSWCPPRLEWT
jgi:hypothetical protein